MTEVRYSWPSAWFQPRVYSNDAFPLRASLPVMIARDRQDDDVVLEIRYWRESSGAIRGDCDICDGFGQYLWESDSIYYTGIKTEASEVDWAVNGLGHFLDLLEQRLDLVLAEMSDLSTSTGIPESDQEAADGGGLRQSPTRRT